MSKAQIAPVTKEVNRSLNNAANVEYAKASTQDPEFGTKRLLDTLANRNNELEQKAPLTDNKQSAEEKIQLEDDPVDMNSALYFTKKDEKGNEQKMKEEDKTRLKFKHNVQPLHKGQPVHNSEVEVSQTSASSAISTAFDWIATEEHMVLFEERKYKSQEDGKILLKVVVRVYQPKSDGLSLVPFFETFELPWILCEKEKTFQKEGKISLKDGSTLLAVRYGKIAGSRRMKGLRPYDRFYFPDSQRPQSMEDFRREDIGFYKLFDGPQEAGDKKDKADLAPNRMSEETRKFIGRLDNTFRTEEGERLERFKLGRVNQKEEGKKLQIYNSSKEANKMKLGYINYDKLQLRMNLFNGPNGNIVLMNHDLVSSQNTFFLYCISVDGDPYPVNSKFERIYPSKTNEEEPKDTKKIPLAPRIDRPVEREDSCTFFFDVGSSQVYCAIKGLSTSFENASGFREMKSYDKNEVINTFPMGIACKKGDHEVILKTIVQDENKWEVKEQSISFKGIEDFAEIQMVTDKFAYYKNKKHKLRFCSIACREAISLEFDEVNSNSTSENAIEVSENQGALYFSPVGRFIARISAPMVKEKNASESKGEGKEGKIQAVNVSIYMEPIPKINIMNKTSLKLPGSWSDRPFRVDQLKNAKNPKSWFPTDHPGWEKYEDLVEFGRVLHCNPSANESTILFYTAMVYIKNPILYIQSSQEPKGKFVDLKIEIGSEQRFNLKYLNPKYLVLVSGAKESISTGYVIELKTGALKHKIPNVDGGICMIQGQPDKCWVRNSKDQVSFFDMITGSMQIAKLQTEVLIHATDKQLIYSNETDIWQIKVSYNGSLKTGSKVAGGEFMRPFDMDDRFVFNDWRFFYRKSEGVEKLFYFHFEGQTHRNQEFKPVFLKDMKNHDIRISFSDDKKLILIIEELSIFIFAVETQGLIQVDNHKIESNEFEKFTKRNSGFSNLNQFLCCSTDTDTFRLQLNVTADSILFTVIKHMLKSIETEAVLSIRDQKENLLYDYLVACPKYLHEMNPIFAEVVAILDNEAITAKYFQYIDLSQTCQGKEFLQFCIDHSKIKAMKKYIEILQDYYLKNDRNFPFINNDHIIKNLTESEKPISSKYIYEYLKLHLMSDQQDFTGNLKDPNINTITFKLKDENGIVLPDLQTKNKYAKMLLEDNPTETHRFQVYMSHCPLDIRNGSEKSRMLFYRLAQFPDEELVETYSHLIEHKWRKVKLFGMIYAWMFIAMNLMDYLSAGFYLNQLPVIVIAVVFHLYFFTLEVSAFLADKKKHFKRYINWFDAILHPLSVLALITIYVNQKDKAQTLTVEFPRWLGAIRLIFLVTISLRGVSQLVAFDGTRYLISMLTQVFYDVFYFLFIYIYFGLIYALIWQQITSVLIVGWENKESALISLLNTMKLSLSGYDADPEEIFVRTILQVLGGIILQLILQNFLIALVTSTYERVSEQRRITDLREMLEMIYDIDCTYWTPKEDVYQNEYILTLIAKDGDEVTIGQKIEDLADNFEGSVAKLKEQIDHLGQAHQEDIKSLHEKLDQIIESLKPETEEGGAKDEDPANTVAPPLSEQPAHVPANVSRRNEYK